jgi:hypothetical protein
MLASAAIAATQEDYTLALSRNAQHFSKCAQPGKARPVTLDWTLDKSGSVVNISARGNNTDVSPCLMDVVREIRFPAPSQATETIQAFTFEFKSGSPTLIGEGNEIRLIVTPATDFATPPAGNRRTL